MCSLSLVKDGAAGVLEWSVDIVRVVGRVKAMERGCKTARSDCTTALVQIAGV